MAFAEYQLNWSDIGSVELENILRACPFEFLGMVLYKNELRPETLGVVRDLHLADIRTVMITGDSVYTGVAIAEQCGLVDQCPYLVVADENSGLPVWTEINNPDAGTSFDLVQLYYLVSDRNRNVSFGYTVSIAVSSDAYLTMVASPDTRYRTVWYRLRPFVRVYGRFKPDGKTRVVRDYQLEDAKTVVGMCGDGGNDSGALKQAHVGVALSHSADTRILTPAGSTASAAGSSASAAGSDEDGPTLGGSSRGRAETGHQAEDLSDDEHASVHSGSRAGSAAAGGSAHGSHASAGRGSAAGSAVSSTTASIGGTIDRDQPNMVAPFVATGDDLTKVVTVLREGRCYAVTK